MATTTIIPKTVTIDIPTLKEVLGASNDDVIGLVRHKNVNIWSLCRPFVHPTLEDPTDAQRRARDFGFTLNSYLTPEALLTALRAGTAWHSDIPTGDYAGGVAARWQPCRLGDFHGYNHQARQWVSVRQLVNLSSASKSYTVIQPQLTTTGGASPDEELAWEQGATASRCYPCVAAFRKSDSALIFWKTTAKKYSEGGWAALNISSDECGLNINNTECIYMVCMSTVMKTSATALVSGSPQFYPIPALRDGQKEGEATDWPGTVGQVKYHHMLTELKIEVIGVLGGSVTGSQLESQTNLTFRDAKDYMGYKSIDDTENKYLDVNPNTGAFSLLIRMTNTGETALRSTYRRLAASPTFTSGWNEKVSINPECWKATASGFSELMVNTGTKMGNFAEITLTKNQPQLFVLHCPIMTKPSDSGSVQTVQTGLQLETQLTFEWQDQGVNQPNNGNMTPSLLRVKT